MATKRNARQRGFFDRPAGKVAAVAGATSGVVGLWLAYKHFNPSPRDDAFREGPTPVRTTAAHRPASTARRSSYLAAEDTQGLQRKLNQFGNYGLKINGVYDAPTTNAVRSLQLALNAKGAKLAVDGKYGPRTQAAARQHAPAVFNPAVGTSPAAGGIKIPIADLVRVRLAIYGDEAGGRNVRFNIDESGVHQVLMGKDAAYLKAFQQVYNAKYGPGALLTDLGQDVGSDFRSLIAQLGGGLGALPQMMAIRDTFVHDGKGHQMPVARGTIIGDESSRRGQVSRLLTINGLIVYAPSQDLQPY